MKTFRKTIEIGLGILVVIFILAMLNIGLSYIDGRQERIKEIDDTFKELEEIKLDTIAEPMEEIIEQ